MSSKYWLLAALGTVTFIICSSLLVAASTFTYRHPGAPGMYFKLGSSGAPKLQTTSEFVDPVRIAAAGQPTLVIKNPRFLFGDMNLHSVGEHQFEIRNEGVA